MRIFSWGDACQIDWQKRKKLFDQKNQLPSLCFLTKEAFASGLALHI